MRVPLMLQVLVGAMVAPIVGSLVVAPSVVVHLVLRAVCTCFAVMRFAVGEVGHSGEGVTNPPSLIVILVAFPGMFKAFAPTPIHPWLDQSAINAISPATRPMHAP